MRQATPLFDPFHAVHLGIDVTGNYQDAMLFQFDSLAEREKINLFFINHVQFQENLLLNNIPSISVFDDLNPYSDEAAKYLWHGKDYSFYLRHQKPESYHTQPCVPDIVKSNLAHMALYKENTSAFSLPLRARPLDDFLDTNSFNTLIVSGLYLNICVLDTIYDATTLGYKVILAQDQVFGPHSFDQSPDAFQNTWQELLYSFSNAQKKLIIYATSADILATCQQHQTPLKSRQSRQPVFA